MLDQYRDQARLLIDVLPYVAEQEVFALKGGTAINLFHRNLPRLSVDIDLTYLPVNARNAALHEIDEALDRIVGTIRHRRPRYTALRIAGGGNNRSRITVRDRSAQVKIETSPRKLRCRGFSGLLSEQVGSPGMRSVRGHTVGSRVRATARQISD